jgi:hypothetical protein
VPERDGGPYGASNGAGGRLLPSTTPRNPASTRPLRVVLCFAGTYRRGVAARPPSRPPSRIKADHVDDLDFHRPLAAPAGDAQHMALDLRKRSLPHLGAGRAGARVSKHRVPICRGQRLFRSRSGDRRSPDGFGGQFSICLGVGMRQLAGRSVMSWGTPPDPASVGGPPA